MMLQRLADTDEKRTAEAIEPAGPPRRAGAALQLAADRAAYLRQAGEERKATHHSYLRATKFL
jgi:hypothetical protein